MERPAFSRDGIPQKVRSYGTPGVQAITKTATGTGAHSRMPGIRITGDR
jgi:hypothetical protein